MAFINVKQPTPKAFPTEESEQPEVPMPTPAAMTAAMERVVEEIEELDEAERRAIKADAYRKVMHMEIFDNEQEPEFYEVEKEIQAFARERMRVFLGMDPDSRPVASKPVEVKLPFTEQQVEVLASWADGLIQRPQLLAATSAPVRGRPVEQPAIPMTSASTSTAPVTRPQPSVEGQKRRGRPPGTGKNQRAAAALQKTQAPQQEQPQVQTAPGTPQKLPVGAQIDPSTGKAYLEVETIDAKGNAVIKRIDVTDQNQPVGALPKPWPTGHSPLENEGPVTQMRLAKGMENGSGSAPLDGQLSNIVKQFSQ